MTKIAVLAVVDGVKGLALELEIEAKKEGKGGLFLDFRITVDQMSREALKTAFPLLHPGTTDILVRISGNEERGLAWLALGSRATALERLEEAVRVRDPWIVLLRDEPRLAELLAEERFQASAARLLER